MYALIPGGSDDYFEVHRMTERPAFTGLSIQKEGNGWRMSYDPSYSSGLQKLAGKKGYSLSNCLAQCCDVLPLN